MAWVKIDDNAPHHRKQLAAGPLACWLWVCGLAYCQKHATDGLIPGEAVPFLGVKEWHKAVPALLKAGLWTADAPAGYRVHDFLHWNDSAAVRRQRIAESAERVARHRQGKKNAVKRDGNSATPLPDGNGGNKTPIPRPIPLEQEPPKPPSGEGGRFTRAELAQAQTDLRDYRDSQPRYVAPVHREPGRTYPEPRRCPHEPQCDDDAVCLALFAADRRQRVMRAVANGMTPTTLERTATP